MFEHIKRLVKHSAIYGLGGLVSRFLALLLLPLYTSYLSRADYGAIETLLALTTVLVIVLRLGISSAFFRFYFEARDDAGRLRIVRTAFWFTMASSTAGLVAGIALAGPISDALHGTTPSLVRAAFVGLWAQMNYEQLTSLFRVEERSVAFALASLANVLITVAATVVLVAVLDAGPVGVIVGNFLGTLTVYVALLGYRREQLGLEFDKPLFREMNAFGLPLVPTGLALWVMSFSDRLFLNRLAGVAETGLYSIGVRLSSIVVFLFVAFRTAWPAFAFSIEDDDEAKRAYSFVLTYLLLACSWLALALGLLSPWLVQLLTTSRFYEGSRVVAPLAFGAAAFAAYNVVAIGVARVRKTRSNWFVAGAGAVVNIALNLALIPPYGMMGAAVATVAAYTAMFLLMTWRSQRLFPVPYQWRRVATLVGSAVALTVAGKLLDASLPLAVVLTAAYPLVLLALGFYLPAERERLRGLVGAARP